MLGFIAGTVAGSLVVWFWGNDLKRYLTEGTRAFRSKAADTLRAVEDTADGVLDTAKEHMHTSLQAGQDVVRPKTF